MHPKKQNVTRFTFDCPSDLHSIAKIKAASSKKSLKNYLLGLLIKDISENPPKYMNTSDFNNEMNKILTEDSDLMRKLTDR